MASLTRNAIAQIDAFVSVSALTKRRFLDWTGLDDELGFVIPNCIDASSFSPGPKPESLLARYGLHGRTVMMTLGRLSAQEQYKGHDEILDVLPDLATDIQNLSYLIVGDGDDRPRLERKADDLGVADRVVFAGYIDESEKADHYRLADAFVMPGRGEGFGIVYLEALACGIPVVASSLDASREAVRDGDLGEVVDPRDREDLKRGIQAALSTEHGVPEGLAYFSLEAFTQRWHALVDRVFRPGISDVSPETVDVDLSTTPYA